MRDYIRKFTVQYVQPYHQRIKERISFNDALIALLLANLLFSYLSYSAATDAVDEASSAYSLAEEARDSASEAAHYAQNCER